MPPTEPEGAAFTLRKVEKKHKGTVVRRWLWIDLDWPHGFPLHLHPETWLDRVGKSIRFAREHQTGDAAFDARVYIAVDEPRAAAALCDSPEERGAMLALLDRGALEVLGDAGVLQACFDWPDGLNPASDPPVPTTGEGQAWLDETVAALRSLVANAPREAIDVRTSRLRPVLAQTGLILLVALVFSLVASWASTQIVDPDYISRGLARAEIITLGVAAAALLLLAGRVAGRATATRLWLGAVVLLVPLAVMLPFGAVPLLNDALDSSAPRTIVAPVTGKYVTGSRKRRTYNVSVRYWKLPYQTEAISVASSDYFLVRPGIDCLRLTVRAGGLGFERVTAQQIIDCPGVAAPTAPVSRALPFGRLLKGSGFDTWVGAASTYPLAALREGVEGSVVAEVRSRGDGRVDARVVQGSGSALLDDHVRDTLLDSRDLLAPGTRDWVRLPRLRFEIDRRETVPAPVE